MMQEVFAVLAIIGMVVGSGFITGKEIVVFFSRFGEWSFFTIFIATIMLFVLFKLVLDHAHIIMKKINKSKFVFFTNIVLCTLFSSAMFSGIYNLLTFDQKLINFAVFCVILAICCLIFKKGGNFFNKLNLIFVPLMIILFVALLIPKLKNPQIISSDFGYLSIFYAVLYCFLNVSNGCVVLAGLGKNFTKVQKTRVALISSLVLGLILLLTNIVLLANPEILSQEMPMLSVFAGTSRIIMMMLVFIGCLTTLFSLVYSMSSSFRGIYNNEYLNFLLSIIMPLILSLWGFSNIVEYLYPLASVLGGVLLLQLFFVPPLKRGDKKIHSCGKNAKQ